MDSYYQTILERERQHIRETVGITAFEGHTITTIRNGERTVVQSPISAIEAADQENATNHQLTKKLRDCVTIEPVTGRAKNIGFLAHHCHDIPNVPRSYMPLANAIYSIGETVSVSGYPEEDRQDVIRILSELSHYNRLDNCVRNELSRAVSSMRYASERDAKLKKST